MAADAWGIYHYREDTDQFAATCWMLRGTLGVKQQRSDGLWYPVRLGHGGDFLARGCATAEEAKAVVEMLVAMEVV